MSQDALRQAHEAAERADYATARDHYSMVLAQEPSNAEAWLGQARVLWALEAMSEAEDAYMLSIQNDPDNVQAWVELVQLETNAGAVDAAAENLAQALRFHPNHPDLLRCRAGVRAKPSSDTVEGALFNIRAAIFADEIGEAKEELQRFFDRFLQDPRAYLARAELFIATGDDNITELIHALTRQTRQHPNDWEALSLLGRLYLRPSPMRNTRMAVALCEDSWRISAQHPRAGLALAEAWAFVGKRPMANALLGQIAGGEGAEAEVAQAWLEAFEAGENS